MRDDLPSLTAIYVAFSRALATGNPELSQACSDPSASAMLPRALQPLLRVAEQTRAASDLVRSLSLGLTDHLALRTALIDRALVHGIESHGDGVQGERLQVVVLGAGLDARAHRLAALRNVRMFEVDHPATQKLKQRKARSLPVLARELRYVPVDFQRTDFAVELERAGFSRHQPSIWIWEGVTMYLEHAAVDASLARIAQLSAPESMLIATYLTPDVVTGGALLGRWSVRMLGMLSEPVRFTREPERLAALLASHGFEVLSDAAPVDAAPHYGIEVKRPSSLMPKERIAVAAKR